MKTNPNNLPESWSMVFDHNENHPAIIYLKEKHGFKNFWNKFLTLSEFEDMTSK